MHKKDITLKEVYNRYYVEYKPAQVSLPTKEEELERIYERYVALYRDKEALMRRLMVAVDNGKQHCCVFSEIERPVIDLQCVDLQCLFSRRLETILRETVSDEFSMSQCLGENAICNKKIFSVNLRWQTGFEK